MGGTQLAGVLSIVSRAAAQARGQTVDEDADAALRAAVEAQIEAESLPAFLSGRLYDDGVIDPATPAPCWECACPPSPMARSRDVELRRLPDVSAPMISKVLVANRGEIARRVFATCRRLGIGTVAIYTDHDAGAPHVAEADTRVRVPGYLDIDAILSAAKAAGADAIHPGYGFLSENAEFATAVEVVGLTWIGPPVEAVRAMGSKIASKKMMAAAGVPVLEQLDPAAVTDDELPVLVKASAGGGGRGMRVVTDVAALPDEVEAARREAKSAFGDDTVFCERYLPSGHHVEVQIMADAHGTVWAVGERECSIQRRHQKIIEEAPHRWWNAIRACGTGCSRRPGRRPTPSGTPARARSSSWPTTPASSSSWR